MNTIKTQKAVKAYCAEYWDAPDLLTVHVSDTLRARIEGLQEFLKANEDVHSLNIDTPRDFYQSEEELERFQSNARYDVEYLSVFRGFVCIYFQSKWDCAMNAEYNFSLDNSQNEHEYGEEDE
jgi:hypothetical protein